MITRKNLVQRKGFEPLPRVSWFPIPNGLVSVGRSCLKRKGQVRKLNKR